MWFVLCCSPHPCRFPPPLALPAAYPCCCIPPPLPLFIASFFVFAAFFFAFVQLSQSRSLPLFFFSFLSVMLPVAGFFFHLHPAPILLCWSLSCSFSLFLLLLSPSLWDCLSPSFSHCPFPCFVLSRYTAAVQASVIFLLSCSVLHPAPHFWQPLPSSTLLQEPTDRLFPAGATGAVAGRTAEVSEGQREHRGPRAPEQSVSRDWLGA